MKDAFSTFDIAKTLKIKRERLKDWQTRGYIKPSIQEARGRGTKNLFSRWDVYMIKLFEHMVNRGFSREQAAERVKSINTEHTKKPVRVESTWNIIMIGEDPHPDEYPFSFMSKIGNFGETFFPKESRVYGFPDHENMEIPGDLDLSTQIHMINFNWIKGGVDEVLGYSDEDISQRLKRERIQRAELEKRRREEIKKLGLEIRRERRLSRQSEEGET